MDPKVEFDADLNPAQSARAGYSGYGATGGSENPGGLSGWLMKKGLARNARIASYILIALVIANLLIAYVVWHFGTGTSNAPRPIIQGVLKH